jgi:hypothetical protein
MIEEIMLNYLNEVLTAPVYMERPENPPSEYVIIQKLGSSKQNQICSAMMAFQSYAPTLYGAATLNEWVKGAVETSVVLPEISSAKLNSDYNFTNTASKQYRYQAVFNITHYQEAN